jgi:hypothetical protein
MRRIVRVFVRALAAAGGWIVALFFSLSLWERAGERAYHRAITIHIANAVLAGPHPHPLPEGEGIRRGLAAVSRGPGLAGGDAAADQRRAAALSIVGLTGFPGSPSMAAVICCSRAGVTSAAATGALA